MREIEFRGKEIKGGGWVYGYLTKFNNNYIVTYLAENEYKSRIVDAKTVGQYTELTDKNGRKIFDGDILVCNDDLLVVALSLGCFVGFDGNGSMWLLNEINKISVISGNIHDNPELLEEVKE